MLNFYLLVALLMTALLGPGCSNLGMYAAPYGSGEASDEPASPESDDSQAEGEIGDDDDSAASGQAPDQDDTTDDDDSADNDEVGDDDDSAGNDQPGDDDDSLGDDDDTSGDDATDDSSGCEDSPVVGTWVGTFDGSINYIIVLVPGQEDVGGELSFSITCTDRLTISGTMTGTEGGDTDFSATLDGEYNEFTNQLDVTISNGTIELASVYNVDFDGNINGSLLPPSPDYVMEGAWDIEAPPTSGGINISGDGAGTWTAQLQ